MIEIMSEASKVQSSLLLVVISGKANQDTWIDSCMKSVTAALAFLLFVSLPSVVFFPPNPAIITELMNAFKVS